MSINQLTAEQVREILGVPSGEPVDNSGSFILRWQEMILRREYGSLTIHINAGREMRWTEHIEHKQEGK